MNKTCGLTGHASIVAEEEGTANSVPAAAVIQRSQALFGFIGRKGSVGGGVSQTLKFEAQLRSASDTALLEEWRGDRNSRCSSEMRRYREEDPWRKHVSGNYLTLMLEGQGSKRD